MGGYQPVYCINTSGSLLLATAEDVVEELESLADNSHATLVNDAGRQRMLYQRPVNACMYLNWGLLDPKVYHQIVTMWYEF